MTRDHQDDEGSRQGLALHSSELLFRARSRPSCKGVGVSHKGCTN